MPSKGSVVRTEVEVMIRQIPWLRSEVAKGTVAFFRAVDPNSSGHVVTRSSRAISRVSGSVGRFGNKSIEFGFCDAQTALPDLNCAKFVGSDETPEMRPPDGKAFEGLFYG